MTKSRIALLLAAAAPAAAWGQLPIDRGQLPIAPAGECSAQANGIGNCPHATAEDALAAGQAIVRETVRPDCSRGGEEIVVCGRRDESDRHRLPLRVEPGPRAADRAGGEQMAAVQVDTSRCTAVGQNQQCGGGLPVIPIAMWLLQNVAKAIGGDD
jgi:hypothetical protein